jgi:hypothetical protein
MSAHSVAVKLRDCFDGEWVPFAGSPQRVEVTRDKPGWGHQRIQSESARLGHQIAPSTVWRSLTRPGSTRTVRGTRRLHLAGVTTNPGGTWVGSAGPEAGHEVGDASLADRKRFAHVS